MVIVKYRTNRDVDIYFPEYDWTAKNREYKGFKNGNIKCPYERRYFGVGYIGEGKYKVWENGKNTKCYKTWHNMLNRCYDEKFHEKYPTYIGCEVDKNWHNFQNFAEWYYNNYYEIEGGKMCLDKDILYKHNKVYSPKTCIFVPQTINSLFVKRDNNRGESVIGTSLKMVDIEYNVGRLTQKLENQNKNILGIMIHKKKHLKFINITKRRI